MQRVGARDPQPHHDPNQMRPHCYNGCPEQQKPYCRCVYERRRARHAWELSEIESRLGELRRKQTEQVGAIVSIAAVSIVIPGSRWSRSPHVSSLQPYV